MTLSLFDLPSRVGRSNGEIAHFRSAGKVDFLETHGQFNTCGYSSGDGYCIHIEIVVAHSFRVTGF